MNIVRFLAFAAALALPTAALAQPEHVRPGTPLDTTFIVLRTDTVAVLEGRYGGDTLMVGYGVMETRTHVVGGVRQVVHVQRLFIEGYPEALVADSAHLHWSTLLPISAHTRGDPPRDLHFGPGSVRVTSFPGSDYFDPADSGSRTSDTTTSEVALAEPVFYIVADLLLRALPLRPGYQAVLPVVTDVGELSKMRVTVTGEGTARALDGAACPVLVVEVEEENYGGIFRISSVNRAIIRFDNEFTTLVRPAGCP